MLTKMRKAKGFTLVELLIVLVIIGILAGGMMMVMGSGTDKAAATRAISDTRSLKASVVQYYGDNMSAAASAYTLAAIEKYADKTLDVVQYATGLSGDNIYVGIKISNAGVFDKFKEIVSNEGLTFYPSAAGCANKTTMSTPGTGLIAVTGTTAYDSGKPWMYTFAK